MLLYYTLLSYSLPLSFAGCALYGVFLPFLPFPATVIIVVVAAVMFSFMLLLRISIKINCRNQKLAWKLHAQNTQTNFPTN